MSVAAPCPHCKTPVRIPEGNRAKLHECPRCKMTLRLSYDPKREPPLLLTPEVTEKTEVPAEPEPFLSAADRRRNTLQTVLVCRILLWSLGSLLGLVLALAVQPDRSENYLSNISAHAEAIRRLLLVAFGCVAVDRILAAIDSHHRSPPDQS